jgi:hypothetical protein
MRKTSIEKDHYVTSRAQLIRHSTINSICSVQKHWNMQEYRYLRLTCAMT